MKKEKNIKISIIEIEYIINYMFEYSINKLNVGITKTDYFRIQEKAKSSDELEFILEDWINLLEAPSGLLADLRFDTITKETKFKIPLIKVGDKYRLNIGKKEK